jgi:ferredoxin-NADP reductase
MVQLRSEGVHFVGLVNVANLKAGGMGSLGHEQLEWLEDEGSFGLHNNTARPAVFLAGGIGIAPFLSMLSYATGEKLRHSIVLFYANRHLEDAAFMDSLWKLECANPRFHFVPTLRRMANNNGGWKGRTGHISSEMLVTQLGIVRGPIY